MDLEFPTAYRAILEKVDIIDPLKYERTRNYLDGGVTCLSPYISRGVISTKQVLKSLLEKGNKLSQIESLVKELCWRDYFQRVAQVKDLQREIRQEQASILNHEISSQIVNAATGINVIDDAIKQLYQTGYMHNHCRLYTASIACNIAKSHWHHPAQWMYYHLLDGDWASNACSWQWVAGANSNKKYYANQENINKYSNSYQSDTFLNRPYEVLETLETPASLLDTQKFRLALDIPEPVTIQFKPGYPTFIYNYYNLDPLWHKEEIGNRVLLLEPEFFSKYPVSRKCIDFMLSLSKNIPDIQIYTGSFKSYTDNYNVQTIYYKEHPLNFGYTGIIEERDWITEKVLGYYPSFFSYWKKVKKQLSQVYT